MTPSGSMPPSRLSAIQRASSIREITNPSFARLTSSGRRRYLARRHEAAKTDRALKSLVDDLAKPGAKVDAVYKKLKKQQKAVEDKKAADKARRLIKRTHANGVHAGDSFTLGDEIPDDSCSLIFTDPPYDRDSLPLFDKLSQLASRILIDGGSCITYCGQYVLPEVIAKLQTDLRFFWICCCQHTGGTAQMKEYGVKVKWKPMLWFVKGQFRRDRTVWVDDLVVSEEEKDAHPWQQSVIEAKHFIETLTVDGDLIVDPCCGGGTTAMAAKELGRQWWTADIDPTAVATARERLHDSDV